MALQTLNTIKQWFKTGLKPTQAQFWDTWDSFRHKFDKIPVKEVEGLDELLLSKADKTVLDHHLADKNAHAPQVNTDWNSESGFSQLLNKPEFKTINGESLTGDGDIIIEAGGSQDLQTTLANGNETTNGIMFNDDYYNWLKTSIDSRSIRLTDSNSDMLVAIDSAGVVTRDDSQHVSLNPQGIFFNRDTAESYLRMNTSSTGVSTVNLPATEGAEITLTATDDFKTINGESIIGEGNLDIEPQGLKSVLDADPTVSYGESKATVMGDYGTSKYNELIVSDEIEKTGIYQLKNQLSFDHTALDSNDIGNITLSEGNIKLTRDKSNNQTVVDIADPVANTQLRFPAKSEEGKTYTIATTDDFKTINGESIVGSGDILINGGDGNIPTLQEVLDKDRNATNASINLLSEEGESQTTVHEGGLNISEKTETGFLITDINKLGVSVSKDEETTFANISADELSLNKNLSGNPVKQGIVLNEDSAGTSTIKLPLTSDGDVKTLTTTEDFKTINGESIVGEGDITIGGGNGDIPTLQQVLDSGNETENSKVILRAGVTSVGTNIIDGYAVEMRLDNRILVANTSQVALTAGNKGSQLVPEGLKSFDNQGTMNILNYPYKPFGTYTLATTSDFKTINGQSIIGSENLVIGSGSQNLQQTLNNGKSAAFNNKQSISFFDPNIIDNKTFRITSLNDSSTGMASLNLSPDIVQLAGTNSPGLSGSFAVANGILSINQTSSATSANNILEFEEPLYNTKIKVPAKKALSIGKYYTLATTSDFKTINNQSIVGDGNISIPVPTLNDIFDNGGRALTGGRYITNTMGTYKGEFSGSELSYSDTDSRISSKFTTHSISWRTPNSIWDTSFSGLGGGGANFILPEKSAGSTQILATVNDFKTINGESILGEGNITISDGGGEIPTLQQVLSTGYKSQQQINLGYIYQGGSLSETILDGSGLELKPIPNFEESYTKILRGSVITGSDSARRAVLNYSSVSFHNSLGKTRLILLDDLAQNYCDFRIPNTKPTGSYTLAITDDIKLKSYTVSTLPDGTIGDQAYVTDATAPAYLGTLTGGGSVVCPVFYNGTTWVSH